MAIEQSAPSTGSARVANPEFGALVDQLQLAEASIQDLRRWLALSENEIGVLSTTVASAPEVEADLTRLTRDYNVLLAQYEQLIQRRESAQIARDLDSGISRIEYRIIDPPVVPLQPIGPPRGMFLATILMVGFGSGVAFAIGRQLMSGSFLTVDQLKAAIDLPILGGVSEAIRPSQAGGAMAGWAGVASGSPCLGGRFCSAPLPLRGWTADVGIGQCCNEHARVAVAVDLGETLMAVLRSKGPSGAHLPTCTHPGQTLAPKSAVRNPKTRVS